MANLSHDDVRHIAKLARLHLREEEVEKFSKELTSILQYVEKLQTVDTKGVEPTAQVAGLANVFRKDAVQESDATAADLLSCSPLPIIEKQIQTPSAHGS
ncbi:Asp-tRNA(Asn)/Glu-tRNA(Gln) amidotransferase GatCAB subunit C [Candidatus Peregrinibacteria bacterium CG10_big_fil_rev_8_21_14_0_10_54_7]|nr:MAG: Asp-tRNA(Asn)/Glu-tRNA(Gln) amidotransferase GatCAB subunit C [Candidatus Peregrinibacteria bacterium CG10_big_fil_rev_8_21_14_0_10_54_7]